MVVTLEINTRKSGHKKFSCQHGRKLWLNMIHQWSHTGHQENHALRSHKALLRGHTKHLVFSVRPFRRTHIFHIYPSFSASKFNCMTNYQ